MTNTDHHGSTVPRDADRRAFLRTGAALAGAVLATPLLGAAPAFALPTARQAPPPPGLGRRFHLKMLAVNSELVVRGQLFTVDLSGEVRVEVTSSDPLHPWNLGLTIVDLRVHRVSGSGQAGDLGAVSIELTDGSAAAEGHVRMTSHAPPRWENSLSLDVTMSIENAPAARDAARAAEPLTLSTREPGRLVGQLSQFPPRGETYRLADPIDLVAGDAAQTVASLTSFPAQIGEL